MIFTPDQIEELRKIVEIHTTHLIGFNLGIEALTEDDLKVLRDGGVDIEGLKQAFPPYLQSFMFGQLSARLGENRTSTLTYDDFHEYLRRGQFIPLSERERNEYSIARKRSYDHIKSFSGRMESGLVGIIANVDQKTSLDYQKVLKKELERKVLDRKSIQSVILELGGKTKDWGLDWGRIVDTESNTIFQRGRAEEILKQKGEDQLVFKDVYPGACKHCIRLYLTAGIGSKPIVFKLKDLVANGSNVGRKQADWVATVDSTHPFCRCNLREVPRGYEWDEEKGMFALPEGKERPPSRAKVKIQVGNKNFEGVA